MYTQKENIRIICTKAKTFPDGIEAAFALLERTLPQEMGMRPLFGLSKPENGQIVYRAGVQEHEPGEAARFGLESFVLEKGTYLAETIVDWKKAPQRISECFDKLLEDSRLDPASYCVERYSKEGSVVCMVKLID